MPISRNNPLLKRLKNLEKTVFGKQGEIEYDPNFDNWTVDELKQLCRWMEAGAENSPSENLHEKTIKFVNRSNCNNFIEEKVIDLYKKWENNHLT
jgi:hypothetical protein